MWTPSYDIIVETLTGSEFEVTVNDRDTVGYLKAEIQKYEGIPVSQQHLLYKHKELSDAMEMKDIPLVKGSRVKLVLGMKGGPISSKRLFTISSDYDNWLDMSDVFSGDDLINLQSPGLKLLLYKDNKKNVHRLKVRAEKAGDGMKGNSLSRSVIGSGASGQGSSQKERDAAITKQKMDQIKAKLSMKKKRLGGNGGGMTVPEEEDKGNTSRGPAKALEVLGEGRRGGGGAAPVMEGESKLSRSQGQYRHKKRHHHHHQHYHHHHHPQHETVIKEEKTPIGYRPGATGGGSARGTVGGGAAALLATGSHNSPIVGAIGSMLPSAATTTATGAHRKSMPAVIDIGRQEQESATAPFSYGLVNVLHGSTTSASRAPTLELEKRSQIREHLQRNRSFKTISAKNLDFSRDCVASHIGGTGGVGGGGHGGSAGLERSLSFHSNGILNRMNSETTLDGGGSSIRRCTNLGHPRAGACIGQSRIGATTSGCTTTQSLHQLDEKVSSASLHDLIELLKYTHSKQQRTISNDSLNKLVLNYSKKMLIPQLYHPATTSGASTKKSLPDINPSLNNIDEYLPNFDVGKLHTTAAGTAGSGGAIPKGLIGRSSGEEGRECKIASAEIAYKNAGGGAGVDKTYRTLCKSISDDSSVYELPKLLVREDSPVESFLGSYSQLETVALRGDSPKNNFTSTSSLQEVAGCGGTLLDDPGTTTAATMSESLLELRPIATKTTPASIVGEAKRASESLLQLAQIAAESVKACSVTPPAAAAAINDITPSPKLFASNGGLMAGVTANTSCDDVGGPLDGVVLGEGGNTMPNTSSIDSSWCQHWNHQPQQQQQQQQDNPFLWNLQQVSCSRPQHHHSDLGINELELKFVHPEPNDRRGDDTGGNVIKLPAIPNLEINTNWLSGCWDSLRFDREDEDADDEALDEEEGGEVCEHEEDDEAEGVMDGEELPEADQERVQTSSSCSSIQRPHRATSNSTSFIHSNLSISSDEDDLLSVAHELGGDGAGSGGPGGGGTVGAGSSSCSAYKAGSNKSKSIDLNEFRKAFGSSPTLLNGFAAGVGTSYTRLVPQLSRLETIPSQYRRGYTNLNDACLSSSTSELECVSNGAAKKKHPLATGGLLPPEEDRNVLSSALLKYSKNGNIPYVRSNENLNRYKVSLGSSGGTRRRSGDSEVLGGGGDALYLRQQRQQSAGSNNAGRHLHGIRDHLASIADSELGDSFAGGCHSSSNNSSHNSTGSNLNEDDENNASSSRCFTVDGDFECRFSRLSCCSGTTPAGGAKSVSPNGVDATTGGSAGYQHHRHHQHQQQHASPGLSAIGNGLRGANSTTSVSGDRNHRMLFGDEGRSSMPRLSGSDGGGAGTSTTTTPLRPSDYYFPSDESLFNMDSFFDDFVEIDTSDIFDSTEFININAPGVGGRKGSSQGGSLLLPDIHTQQQQQHHMGEQQQKSSFSSPSAQYLYFQPKDQRMQGQQGQRRVLHTPPPGFRANNYEDQLLKCSTRYAFMHAGGDYGDDDDDDDEDVDDDEDEDEEEGIASIIQHIDREQLCDEPRRATSSSAVSLAAAAVSSSLVTLHGGRGRHSASSERLLRLQNSQLPPHRSHSSAMVSLPATMPAESNDIAASKTTTTTTTTTTTEPEKQKKLRCAQCNKKLGMVMIMKCHCEKVFCAQHRYAEAHSCSYNFKLEGRKVLEKNNPLVVADKLPKI